MLRPQPAPKRETTTTDITVGRPQPTAVEGVRGAISNPGGYGLCGSDGSVGNFTTSWVMIVDRDLRRYSQAGYMYRANSAGCVRLWAQDDFGFGAHDYYTGGCVPLGATHTFWEQMVKVNINTYHLRSNVETTIIHESSSSPFDYWPQPFQIEVFNEVTYPGSDIAGRIDNKQNFSALEAQRFSDDTYVSFINNVPLGPDDNIPGKWKYEALAPDHLRLWEEP